MGSVFKKVKKLTPLDWISLATAIPISAATDPLRPLNLLSGGTNELEPPSAPPEPPQVSVATDDDIIRKRKAGRLSTLLTTPGSLSTVQTSKPTLLGQ